MLQYLDNKKSAKSALFKYIDIPYMVGY